MIWKDNKNMTLDEMKKIKKQRGYTLRMLSEYTGLPVLTLQKIFAGHTKNPRKRTMEALERVLLGDEIIYRGKTSPRAEEREKRGIVCETSGYEKFAGERSHKYPLQGSYTVEDYFALPDEQRVELIDGVFYDMASPTILHQDIIFYFQIKIYQYISEKKRPCKVIQAPLDVQPDEDERTIVQPDLLVLCDRGKVKNGRIFGAPEFALEVLSPSTHNKDMTLKVKKYGEAGVQEYWIFDPDKRVLITYNFTVDGFLPQIHPLSDKVPLMLTGGELIVDLEPLGGILDEWEMAGAAT